MNIIWTGDGQVPPVPPPRDKINRGREPLTLRKGRKGMDSLASQGMTAVCGAFPAGAPSLRSGERQKGGARPAIP